MKSQSPPKQNMPQFTAAEMFFGMTVYTLVVLQSAYSVYKSSLGELLSYSTLQTEIFTGLNFGSWEVFQFKNDQNRSHIVQSQ